jgi:TRAP-type C4-dicarboxylate transport system substrate-binding protein
MIIKILKEGHSMKLIALLLIALLAISVTGCGKQSAEPSEQEEKKVQIVMGHPFSAQHPISQQILLPLAKELEEKSNGRIQLTIHAGGSVTSAATIREDVATGVIDMGWTLQGYTPGKYPLTEVVELPFLFDSALRGSKVLWKLFEQSPALQQEYGDVKVIGLWVTDPGELLSKKPIRKPEDLSGMRIRFAGKAQETLIKKFGGIPVGMPAPEMYDALERGVLDGVAIGPSVIQSYKLHEVINYTTLGLNSFASAQVIFMNKEKWNSLSPEDQELFASLTGEIIAVKAGKIYDAGWQKGLDMAKAANIEVYKITPEERENWRQLTLTVVDEWIKDVSSRGLPAQEVYDLMMKIKDEIE